MGIRPRPGRTPLLKALHTKGATLSQLARANLTFDGAQAFDVFDGHELRACPDAAAAIAAGCGPNARAPLSILAASVRAFKKNGIA